MMISPPPTATVNVNREELSKTKIQSNEVTNQLKRTKSAIKTRVSADIESQKERDSLKVKRDSLKVKRDSLKVERDNLKAECAGNMVVIGELEVKLNLSTKDLEERLARLESNQRATGTTIGHLQTTISDLQATIIKQQATISDLQTTISGQQATISDLKATISDQRITPSTAFKTRLGSY